MNIDILGFIELKWTGIGKFSSDNHYIYCPGQESRRENRAALSQQKSSKYSTWV